MQIFLSFRHKLQYRFLILMCCVDIYFKRNNQTQLPLNKSIGMKKNATSEISSSTQYLTVPEVRSKLKEKNSALLNDN